MKKFWKNQRFQGFLTGALSCGLALSLCGAAFAASECGTCRVQIRHGSGKTALHPVSILRMRLEGRQPSGSQG